VATTSTASSGTEGPEPSEPREGTQAEGGPGSQAGHPSALPASGQAAPPTPDGTPTKPPPTDHDPARRAFFKAFGRQAVTTVGQVAGLADALGMGPTLAAANLLGLGRGSGTVAPRPRTFTPTPRVAPSPGSPAATRALTSTVQAETAHRSPFRLDGTTIRVLDQRGLPGKVEEVVCRRATDVVFYLRVGAARGGPLMAQLAAYALAMSAEETKERSGAFRDGEARRVRRSLTLARPSSRLVPWAVERMARVVARYPGDEDGPAAAQALREEADRIAGLMQVDQAAIARHLVASLPSPEGRPLSLLVHGAPGAVAGGAMGTVITAITTMAGEGRALTVRVTETRPFLDGARLTTWELRQAGIVHQVLPDSAVAWLLANEPVDAILMAGEWIAANGDTATVVGGRAIALQAAAGQDGSGERPVPLLVTALTATIDPAIPDGAAIPGEMRPARELSAFQPVFSADRLNALNPATDVIPARLVGALVTERGILASITPEAIAELVPAAEPEPAAEAEPAEPEQAAEPEAPPGPGDPPDR
jgi:methylthioribose-1-phosphate isomerase